MNRYIIKTRQLIERTHHIFTSTQEEAERLALYPVGVVASSSNTVVFSIEELPLPVEHTYGAHAMDAMVRYLTKE